MKSIIMHEFKFYFLILIIKNEFIMKCENCKNGHNGNYGSGRFCSSKCARGFSTKVKRKEINEKISNSMKNNMIGKKHHK